MGNHRQSHFPRGLQKQMSVLPPPFSFPPFLLAPPPPPPPPTPTPTNVPFISKCSCRDTMVVHWLHLYCVVCVSERRVSSFLAWKSSSPETPWFCITVAFCVGGLRGRVHITGLDGVGHLGGYPTTETQVGARLQHTVAWPESVAVVLLLTKLMLTTS